MRQFLLSRYQVCSAGRFGGEPYPNRLQCERKGEFLCSRAPETSELSFKSQNKMGTILNAYKLSTEKHSTTTLFYLKYTEILQIYKLSKMNSIYKHS